MEADETLANGTPTATANKLMDFAQVEAAQLSAFTDKALKQGAVYAAEVEKVIRKRPLTAVAVAAGVGALAVGFLFRPRN